MTAPLRVLIVEDSETDTKLVTRELKRAGHTVEIERADDAASLKALLERRRWDVVISDWSMPGFSALEALALVRGVQPDVPVIIVSGTVGEETAVEAMRSGANDYVLKDKLARLAPAVERELRQSEIRLARHRADDAVRDSEARYRALFEHSPLPKWLYDVETLRFLEVNDAAVRHYGYTREEFLHMTIEDIRPPEDVAALRAVVRPESGSPTHVGVWRHRKKDGTPIEVDIRGHTLVLGGRATRLVVVQDVTERRKEEEARARLTDKLERELAERTRVEMALRLSEARLRSLTESGLMLITYSDTHGRIFEVNDTATRMLGYSRAELCAGGVRWRDVTPPEWRHADEVAIQELLATGVARPWEKELIRKDGGRVPVLAGAALVEGAEGIGIAVDLTALKRAQKELLERVSLAALSADVGMAATRGDTMRGMLQQCVEAIVARLDAAFARIWTLNGEKGVLELQASAGLNTHIDGPHARVRVGELKIGKIAAERTPYHTNDVANDPLVDAHWVRRERLVSFAGHPLLVGGTPVGVMALFARHPLTEVTQRGLAAIADAVAVGIQRKLAEAARTSLEAQLRQAQKLEAIGSLAGGMAHDFNNIISVIATYTNLLIEDLPPGDPMRADIEEIRAAGARAADLTRQLLAFSRRQILQPRIVDLNDIVAGMEKMLQRLIGEDVELVVIASATPATVHIDPGQIEQVIMNLAANARDAMPAGGRLSIAIGHARLDEPYAAAHPGVAPGPYVVLSVTDTGMGMDAATQSRIFEPFFTTKEVGKGTGLGLSTVFGIIRQSEGTIAVDSEPGKGASFRIYLRPAEAHAGDRRVLSPTAELTPLMGSETILLVEDEERVRKATAAILLRAGYHVLEAQSGGDALLICEQRPGAIHVLLTDVVMPRMSGVQLAARLASIQPGLRVVYMSGYTDNSALLHDVLASNVAFVQKPITPQALLRTVRDALEAPPVTPARRGDR